MNISYLAELTPKPAPKISKRFLGRIGKGIDYHTVYIRYYLEM
ncbi:MAG: hypothetical protein V1933_06335 [Candidatus Omnitrophota bacterium]